MSDDVMILDSGDEIYVWVGNEASDDEKKKGLGVAKVRSLKWYKFEKKSTFEIFRPSIACISFRNIWI